LISHKWFDKKAPVKKLEQNPSRFSRLKNRVLAGQQEETHAKDND
jgi:hypothetical protein